MNVPYAKVQIENFVSTYSEEIERLFDTCCSSRPPDTLLPEFKALLLSCIEFMEME